MNLTPLIHTVDFAEYQLPLGRQQMPSPGMVDLWWIDLDSVGDSITSGGAVAVNPGQQVRARRFASRFLTKMLLGAYLHVPGKDVFLIRNKYGKPDLDPARHVEPLFFNISHSHQWMLFAVNATTAVGVDLENIRRKTDPVRLASRYFATTEVEALQLLDEDLRRTAFLRAWTHKEAVLKARGLGLAGNMSRVVVEMNPEMPPRVIADRDGGPEWRLIDFALADGMIGALAFAGELDGINAWRLLAPPSRTYS